MAIESTAINDLIAGLQQRPLQRDSDDWLFGERDDATEIDTSREDKATSPFDRSTPAVVSLPRSFVRQPAAAIDYALNRPSSPTTHVRPNWPSIAKKLALPIGLFSIFVVLLGVYFAKSDGKRVEAKSIAPASVESKQAIKVVAAVAPAPAAATVVPIDEPPVEGVKVEATVEEVTAAPQVEAPQVEAPQVEAAQVAAPQVAAPQVAAPQVAAPKVAAPKVAAPKVAAPKVEAPKVEPPVAAAPAPSVEPGSPASRFLGNGVEPTIPTVAPKAAPAPQTVPNLAPPKPTAAPVAAKPAVTSTAKTVSKRAEKRATAKRAAKASLAVSKARSKRQVATASDDEEEETPAKPKGKGVLSIASTPAMEVWVDGRNSNAQTPVRIILLAGKHKVTLFDKQHAKAKSFEIVIKPDETTKVVKSYQ
jgi:hypothetical protein